jgi:hypothetical protein
MTQYDFTTLTLGDLDRLELPKFQRGLVWTKSKQVDLIATLHQGFPFGSILVYEKRAGSDSKTLLLLDGQQRLSTIKNYIENKLSFWKPLNKEYYRKILMEVNEILNYEKEVSEKEFDEAINYNDEKFNDFIEDFGEERETRKAIREKFSQLRSKMNAYVDIENLKIPVIKYTGDEENIARVFENLNKGGTPLTKYEVYNATWAYESIALSESDIQNEILQNVINYYDDMIKNGEFELNNFSRDDLAVNRNINLAELGIAIGRYVVNKMPSLISENKNSANEYGFSLLGLSVNVSNSGNGLDKLIKHVDSIQNELESTMIKIEKISSDLNATFGKLLKRNKGGNDSEFMTGLSSSNKILSYFASLWELEGKSYTNTLNNLPAYYVIDYLKGTWSGHGDGRLVKYFPEVKELSYEDSVTLDELDSSFENWIEEQFSGKGNIYFKDYTKALATMHANLTYLSDEISDGQTMEFEHIIPKVKVSNKDSGTEKYVYAANLGNAMYLPKDLNNGKKEKTLYEVKENYQQLISESFYFTNEEFNEIFDKLDNSGFDIVNKYIKFRAMKVVKDLSKHLVLSKF